VDSDELAADIRDPYPPVPMGGGPNWMCLSCRYNLNTGGKCINCGRDRWGTDPSPGAPEADAKPHRPGLRG